MLMSVADTIVVSRKAFPGVAAVLVLPSWAELTPGRE
jgi:hypothetical protein